MALRRFSKRQDLGIYYFYDDFNGSTTEGCWWTTRGSGSLALQTNGTVRVRASNNSIYEMYQGDLPDFSAAKQAAMSIRAYISSLTSNLGEVGFEAASPNNANDRILLFYDVTVGANWRAECRAGGTPTTIDTLLPAAATTFYEFRIEATSTAVKFFNGSTLLTTISTNITTLLLQPYVLSRSITGGSRDVFVDWIEATGDRE